VVEKAGEIIPQVVAVRKDRRPRGVKAFGPPKKCPECSAEVRKDVDGVYLRCTNPACGAQVVERLKHFAGRGQMDIEGLGGALIEQLVESRMVKTFADIYRLEADKVAELERMGPKSASNLIAAIEASKEQPLGRVLAGLGILHVGARAAQVLAERFGSMQAVLDADVEELEQIDEIGPVIARSVWQFCHDDKTRKVIEELVAVGLKMPGPPRAESDSGVLAGQTVVVTGTVEGYTREAMASLISRCGGRPSSSVSSKTDLVVIGENPGSKADKAVQLGVRTMSAGEFLKMVGR